MFDQFFLRENQTKKFMMGRQGGTGFSDNKYSLWLESHVEQKLNLNWKKNCTLENNRCK